LFGLYRRVFPMFGFTPLLIFYIPKYHFSSYGFI